MKKLTVAVSGLGLGFAPGLSFASPDSLTTAITGATVNTTYVLAWLGICVVGYVALWGYRKFISTAGKRS